MNIKSLLITIAVAFVTVWATDFLIHAVWLSATYAATKELWRSESEMLAKMPWMLFGQLLIAAAFSMMFALFVAEKRSLPATLAYAAAVGLLNCAGQIIMFAVQPFPGVLVAQWCLAYFVQALLLGLIVHKIYRLPPGRLS
jgi:hypothetical protein